MPAAPVAPLQHSNEPLLTKRELAAVLKVSTRKVDLDVGDGMPWVPVGSFKRFRLSEVLDWHRRRRA